MMVCLLTCCMLGDSGTTLKIVPGDNPRTVEVRVPLSGPSLRQIPVGKLTQDQGEQWLQFSLVEGKKPGPPIFGTYERREKILIFQPRYPLVYEQTYQATFQPQKGKSFRAKYTVPPAPPAPAPLVEEVYPGGNVLPANNLKFYIYFSRPMQGGKDIFQHIYLLDSEGTKIVGAWLEDELWDEDNQRLLLIVHPGRIKWGLLLRKLFGPVFYPNRKYTLVISRGMKDQEGRSLGKEYRKSFSTTAEHRQRIDLAQWKLEIPQAGTKNPVQVTSRLALDHRSMERFLKVVDASGQKVPGKIEIRKDETVWQFRPATNWKKGDYRLLIDPQFEDVAGNTPEVPFDRDLKAPPLPSLELALTFRPR